MRKSFVNACLYFSLYYKNVQKQWVKCDEINLFAIKYYVARFFYKTDHCVGGE